MTPGSVAVGYLDAGQWSACFGLSYRDLLLYDQGGAGRIVRQGGAELRAVTGTGGVAINRNKVAARFLDETDAEWLFVVDTDMGFAADSVERLLESADPVERPVMGALCFSATREKVKGLGYAERFRIQPTVYTWIDTPDQVGVLPVLDYPRDAVVQAGATGAACIVIHRDVLAKMRARYGGDCWYDPITHPTGQDGRPRTFSEDLSFCVRLAACDIPLHINTGVKTTHEKGCVYLDEETFDRQMMLLQLEDEIVRTFAESEAS